MSRIQITFTTYVLNILSVYTRDFIHEYKLIFYCFLFIFLCVCVCVQPLAGNDYLQIAQFFHTVLIRNLPQLNLDSKSQARRFITLVDTLYDNKVRVRMMTQRSATNKYSAFLLYSVFQVVVSSEVSLPNLFSARSEKTGISDDHRMLMDDLKISPDSVSTLKIYFILLQ